MSANPKNSYRRFRNAVVRNRLNIVLVLLAALTAVPVFFVLKPATYRYNVTGLQERYDSSLARRFTSTQMLVDSIDRRFQHTAVTKDSTEYWYELAELVAYRFYHNPSTYQLDQNWILYLLGRYVWRNLYFCIIPDHIMQSPSAWCHQQAIIMMECMRKKNIDYRAVYLPNHFSLEGFIAGKWRYFDTNKEPRFLGHNWSSYDELLEAGALDDQYNMEVYGRLNKSSKLHLFGEINHYYGWRCAVFQTLTRFLSNTLWVFFLLVLLFKTYIKNVLKKKRVVRAGTYVIHRAVRRRRMRSLSVEETIA